MLAKVDGTGVTGFVGTRRRILVDVTGKKKAGLVANEKPRKRRRRRKKAAEGSTPAPARASRKAKANGSYSLAQKKAALRTLAAVANPEIAGILAAIGKDLEKVARADRIEKAIEES